LSLGAALMPGHAGAGFSGRSMQRPASMQLPIKLGQQPANRDKHLVSVRCPPASRF
jgi:hypothetical protein